MLVFFVGPSKVGKTTLLRGLMPYFQGATLIDLDKEENAAVSRLQKAGIDPGGWAGRWNRCRSVLDKVEQEQRAIGDLAFVDVGAGCLQTEAALQYFHSHSRTTILMIASFETILSRHKGRDREDLRRIEFSDQHMSLYKELWSVDTGRLSLEVAAEEIVGHIKVLLQDERSE